MAQSGGSLNMRWLSRLPLQLRGREASPQDKSCLPSVSQALKSADSGVVSSRERKFSSWVSLTAMIVFQQCPLLLSLLHCSVGAASVSPLLGGTSYFAAAATEGEGEGRGPWLGKELEVERGRRRDCK